MKQYKVERKAAPQAAPKARQTTRQELDSLTRQVAGHIAKNPKKAAKIFESWLEGKAVHPAKKKAA